MLLAADIGNTHITLGLFTRRGAALSEAPEATWRLATERHRTADEYGVQLRGLLRENGLDPADVRGLMVASVVPPLDPVFQDLARKYFKKAKILFVDADLRTGVKILYKNPREVGADRIANAAGAYARVKGACIVADFGTSANFDCVNGRGDYLGGAIAPGPLMGAEALARRTAKLPLVGRFEPPRNVVGQSTEDCIRSGLFYGYVGLTEELLRRLKADMGGNPVVLATGGLAAIVARSVKAIKHVVPDLTLEGLRLLWERNTK